MRVRGFVAGRWTEDPKYWIVTVSDCEHILFKKNIRALSIRQGVTLKRNATIDFEVTKEGRKNFATDVKLA